MSATLSLRIETRRDELRRLDAAVEDLAQAEGWPPDLVFQIKLVLEELGINIVNHGHDDGRSHEIEIELTSNADALTIEITDVNGGAKRDHYGGVKWDHLAAAGLSPQSMGGSRARRGVPSTGRRGGARGRDLWAHGVKRGLSDWFSSPSGFDACGSG